MKTRSIQLFIFIFIISVMSCNDPVTIVTDIVHPDGSVTRKIEMRNDNNEFKASEIQVPFDSTWILRDSLEIQNNGDTIWVRRAEKFFENTAKLNESYQDDKSANKEVGRHSVFSKKFRWFNTEYHFAEIVDRSFTYGYPASDFLDSEELNFFFSPGEFKDKLKEGADSLKYRTLEDTIAYKTDQWYLKSAISEWIGQFAQLTKGRGAAGVMLENLRNREDELVRIIEKDDDNFDSLWQNGQILRQFLGESEAVTFRTEADSAMDMVTDRLFLNFGQYTQSIVMPGKLLGTNGFRDSSQILLWPVKSDYFLTEPYEMWAESKAINIWAWIVTGVFLVFVITGFTIKLVRK